MDGYEIDFADLLELMAEAIEEEMEMQEMDEFIASSPYGYHYCPTCS